MAVAVEQKDTVTQEALDKLVEENKTISTANTQRSSRYSEMKEYLKRLGDLGIEIAIGGKQTSLDGGAVRYARENFGGLYFEVERSHKSCHLLIQRYSNDGAKMNPSLRISHTKTVLDLNALDTKVDTVIPEDLAEITGVVLRKVEIEKEMERRAEEEKREQERLAQLQRDRDTEYAKQLGLKDTLETEQGLLNAESDRLRLSFEIPAEGTALLATPKEEPAKVNKVLPLNPAPTSPVVVTKPISEEARAHALAAAGG